MRLDNDASTSIGNAALFTVQMIVEISTFYYYYYNVMSLLYSASRRYGYIFTG